MDEATIKALNAQVNEWAEKKLAEATKELVNA